MKTLSAIQSTEGVHDQQSFLERNATELQGEMDGPVVNTWRLLPNLSNGWDNQTEDQERNRGLGKHNKATRTNTCISESHSVVSGSLQPHGLYSPRNSPGQNTRVSSFSLLQGFFPTQGSNPSLPCCRQILYQLNHKGNPTHIYRTLVKNSTVTFQVN